MARKSLGQVAFENRGTFKSILHPGVSWRTLMPEAKQIYENMARAVVTAANDALIKELRAMARRECEKIDKM